ncbi:MAG: HipA N-terminal domain-containing protein, partial [Oscillospiraceae bacterium]|nr:HipA N-terminal domain-containing protein [Oscillospiraceae bacterium]
MKTLIVSLERNGVLVPVGSISGNNTSDSQFRYSEEYLHDPQAAALSISLPLQEQPYSPYQTRGFFEGLLPEGFTRRSVAQWMHVDEDDYLSLLHGLGR